MLYLAELLKITSTDSGPIKGVLIPCFLTSVQRLGELEIQLAQKLSMTIATSIFVPSKLCQKDPLMDSLFQITRITYIVEILLKIYNWINFNVFIYV